MFLRDTDEIHGHRGRDSVFLQDRDVSCGPGRLVEEALIRTDKRRLRIDIVLRLREIYANSDCGHSQMLVSFNVITSGCLRVFLSIEAGYVIQRLLAR